MCGKTTCVDPARWLLIFDNADVPDVIYDWLSSQGPGYILITSKYPYVKEKAYRLDRGMDLETFSPEVGGDMLRKLLGCEDEVDAIGTSIRTSKTLGGLSLAIFRVSAIIRETHLTFKDFEDWYHEDAKELYSLRTRGMRTKIPEELLKDRAKEVQLPNYPTKKHEYFKVRTELVHVSMVTRNLAANELRVHRLVQEVVRYKMGDDNLQTVFAAVATLMNREPDEHERITHWLGGAHHSLSLAVCLTGSSDGVEDADIWVGILHDRIEKYNQKSDKLALAAAYN
ncbi:hypothetical protein B0T24DRAFT_682346 [Lasiosphaeria ovina]|uniref:DUF7779 domain-containing protein n=1 Tax=Lasiosphaeria ovina TaxID=92902 RepID=A0AAE0JZG1_9PEZI|nr:hypothetical protein B0T24DRAFT_682346 [Lasiosphaeria ovina]